MKQNERRKIKRFSVNLKVYDQETDNLLGYAENLHTDGMMLVSEEPVPHLQEIKIWFGATKENKEKSGVFVTAFVIWNSFSETTPRLYYSGLHFASSGRTNLHRIEHIIQEQAEDTI